MKDGKNRKVQGISFEADLLAKAQKKARERRQSLSAYINTLVDYYNQDDTQRDTQQDALPENLTETQAREYFGIKDPVSWRAFRDSNDVPFFYKDGKSRLYPRAALQELSLKLARKTAAKLAI